MRLPADSRARLAEELMHESQHYTNARIESMDDVRRALPDGADYLNWLFVGTSGIHGTSTKLDEYPERQEFTVLIVRPRTVSCLYGSVEVDDEDVEWLRENVAKTISMIQETQSQNLQPDSDQ